MAARYTLEQAQQMHFPILKAGSKNSGAGSIAIDRSVCVVGARRLVHLPLSDASISKAQALIVVESAGIYLRDLASRNQTYVNDQPVREARLETNDVVRFGPYSFQCDSGFDASAEAIPAAPAELWLKTDGPGARQVVPIEQYTFLIGSRYGCDLLLNGPDIALAHAIIFVRDGHRFVRDLSSHTGTVVNGQPCREVELNVGDEIQIGTSLILYQPAGTSLEAESEIGVAEDPNEATHIAQPMEEPAEVEAAEEPIPIAFDELDDMSMPSEREDEVATPWDDREAIAFELEPQETT